MTLQREHVFDLIDNGLHSTEYQLEDLYSGEEIGSTRENGIPSAQVVDLTGEVDGASDCERYFMQGLSPTNYEENGPVPESDQPSASVPQVYITPGSPEHVEPDLSPESPVDDVERSSQAADGRSRNGSPVEARGLIAEEIIHPDPAEPCTPLNQTEPIPNNGPRKREHRRRLISTSSSSRSSSRSSTNRPRRSVRGCQNCCRTAHEQLVLMSNAFRLMGEMLAVYSDHN
ncbi:uncharacterized protein LOC119919181 [Micropterus salmoides]|uniref:uncharacterized protein LOC119896307 n=1 Tax=Micropterus salmoides TaxID=27706 RepID=UPI0018ECCA9E|nr:uncharacterized protein LOC119896307 [Micropterus salmoides]XP_038583876.1 uncharacterized protein LOC119909731 [Micropterus salmoides]XP_038589344.1 uncharacterized protein LOC119914250 [Micropterus salmoides]XP_038593203.1 uncharacterized protein LOC119917148 [Micropterus salmoides]XP_038593204.1 uncharacterized protein LOC119917149 [Micropterus salmoides]XP_038595572.1 uncharacterized protein LOC119919181 [Micropterus salmoides]